MLGRMDPRLKPAAVGVAAGIISVVLPEGIGPVVIVAAALAAGCLLPSAPMQAAVLFLLPALVLGAVRFAIDDGAEVSGGLAVGAVMALIFVAIFTHVGADIAMRRST